MDFKHWYAIFAVTGREERVREWIEREALKTALAVSAFVPKVKLFEVHDKVKIPVYRVMFPSYVLVGTDAIERVYEITEGCRDILRFLRDGEGGFQELGLEEIARLAYMARDSDVIEESEVTLDENDRIIVLSGPLKGLDGFITRFSRRRGRVWVNFLLGTERREIALSVKLVERDTRSEREILERHIYGDDYLERAQ